MGKFGIAFTIAILMVACKEDPSAKEESKQGFRMTDEERNATPQVQKQPEKNFRTFTNLADTTFIRLADFSDGFAYDLRYATENNFLKEKVYDCAECYTRVKTAKALLMANKEFEKYGVRIKFFDCYRPNSVQYKMWAIVPNPQYVANPKKGSIHNKGGAVDITLETLDGKELDMGTDFDFFGKRAYHDMTELPRKILENRKLLKETMEKHGFWSTRTEWWHYNLSGAHKDKVANFKWECE
ncbi:M15 family metallopeptidase [Flavobacteriaceae bacterium TP-CH-4]|uniref:D-alanyl-D-alanine dipeptidase n=1 Tax=Pelagihabitans pacificus TaxID=2696054 RepID=A0A967EAK7_9FLAO|nr:M15 family metallopeptidase [Pelagihabitans pacificus]NHF59536.1 M15 family metallopeptidase [Pelagihabitans pacificus]